MGSRNYSYVTTANHVNMLAREVEPFFSAPWFGRPVYLGGGGEEGASRPVSVTLLSTHHMKRCVYYFNVHSSRVYVTG